MGEGEATGGGISEEYINQLIKECASEVERVFNELAESKASKMFLIGRLLVEHHMKVATLSEREFVRLVAEELYPLLCSETLRKYMQFFNWCVEVASYFGNSIEWGDMSTQLEQFYDKELKGTQKAVQMVAQFMAIYKVRWRHLFEMFKRGLDPSMAIAFLEANPPSKISFKEFVSRLKAEYPSKRGRTVYCAMCGAMLKLNERNETWSYVPLCYECQDRILSGDEQYRP